MQQQISVITLGGTELARSRRLYVEGFGWEPIFENEEIILYQMNGFVLATFSKSALEQDMGRTGLSVAGAFSLAHNVADPDDHAWESAWNPAWAINERGFVTFVL